MTSMTRSTNALLVSVSIALLAGAAGCTIVAPEGMDGGMKPKPKIILVPVRPDALPQPRPLQASVLYVANLQRSSANLAGQYAGIITGLAAYWQSVGLSIANMGLISTYADQYGPRLLLGRSAAAGQPPSALELAAAVASQADAGVANYQNLLPLIGPTLGNIDDSDLPTALGLLASSGSFDGDGQTSEAKNLIEFGQGLNAFALAPVLGGIDRSAFFDVPHDLFIVVYLQPLPRRCALGTSDCNVDGRSPLDIFTDTDVTGGATWLQFSTGSIPPEKIVHVSVATSEGETESAFQARCAAVPGFPRNVLDVIAPSPAAYFKPLMNGLNGAHAGTGHSGDFCSLIGTDPTAALVALGSGVAAVATGH